MLSRCTLVFEAFSYKEAEGFNSLDIDAPRSNAESVNPERARTCRRRAGGQGASARTSFNDDQAAVSRV